ncbi:MAG: transporter [Myxococcota bacterium]
MSRDGTWSFRPGFAICVALACTAGLGAVPSEAHAGAWTLEEGRIWGKAALLYLRSDRIFADTNDERFGLMGCTDGAGNPVQIGLGDRRPYDCLTGGTFQVAALYFDVTVGIVDRWDFTVQVPVILDVSFRNESGLDGSDAGLSDIRLGTKFRILQEPMVLSVAAEVKLPTGDFTTDEAVPPLGEGQFDLGLQVLVGKGFEYGWVGGDVGWRFRLTNPDTRINVGDELLANVEGGIKPLAWLAIPLGVDLLYGMESQEEGVPTSRPRRWVMHVRGGLLFSVTEFLHLEASVRWPVAGAGWPADPIWSFGVMGETPPLWRIGESN